jgi:hypothetical protein
MGIAASRGGITLSLGSFSFTVGDEEWGANRDLGYLLTQQALQLLGVLAAGLVVGAGQHHASLFGCIVGVWNGIICMLIQASSQSNETLTPITLYSQPLLHTAIGGLGALLGASRWPPLPKLATVTEAPITASPLDAPRVRTKRRSLNPFEGISWKVRWLRVFVGTAIAVAGVLSANTILKIVVAQFKEIVQSSPTFRQHQQALTLEIEALAVFVGGVVAGAGTFNGGVHGFCVGLVSATLIFGYKIASGLEFFTTDPNPAFLFGGILLLSLFGGWLASVLLPPVRTDRHKVRPHFS